MCALKYIFFDGELSFPKDQIPVVAIDRHNHLIIHHIRDLGEGVLVKYISLYDREEKAATWQQGVVISDVLIPLEDLSHDTFCTEMPHADLVGQVSQANWAHYLFKIGMNKSILLSFEHCPDKFELEEIHKGEGQAIVVDKQGKFFGFAPKDARILLLTS